MKRQSHRTGPKNPYWDAYMGTAASAAIIISIYALSTFLYTPPPDNTSSKHRTALPTPGQLARGERAEVSPIIATSVPKPEEDLGLPNRDRRGRTIATSGRLLLIFGGATQNCGRSKVEFSKVPFHVYDQIVVFYQGDAAGLDDAPQADADNFRILLLSDIPGLAVSPPEWIGQWYEARLGRLITYQRHLNDRDFRLWDGIQ